MEIVHNGMLRDEHSGDPAAFAFSKNALHHLSNFWKLEALKTIGETLEPGAVFRVHDLVYSFDPTESYGAIEV